LGVIEKFLRSEEMKLNVLKVAVALTVDALLLTACGGPTLKVLSKDEAKGYYDQLMAVKDGEPFAIIQVLEGLSGDECLDVIAYEEYKDKVTDTEGRELCNWIGGLKELSASEVLEMYTEIGNGNFDSLKSISDTAFEDLISFVAWASPDQTEEMRTLLEGLR